MILIGGATGQLGREVVRQLSPQSGKNRFALLARDTAKAKLYQDQGVEVRLADFDAPASLPTAFAGIDHFLFISTMSQDRGPQQIAVVDAAAAAGVRHIIYTGLAIRDISASAVRDLMNSHFETEDRIRASGMEWTFLRNTMYAEAIAQIAGPNALSDGIFLPAGNGRVPYALRAEMGEAAANILLQDGHQGKTYNITGNDNLSYADIAAGLSTLFGKALPYHDIPEDTLREGLRAAGMPEFVIWLTLGTLQDIREGQYDIHSRDLETLLGRTPASPDIILRSVFGVSDH